MLVLVFEMLRAVSDPVDTVSLYLCVRSPLRIVSYASVTPQELAAGRGRV